MVSLLLGVASLSVGVAWFLLLMGIVFLGVAWHARLGGTWWGYTDSRVASLLYCAEVLPQVQPPGVAGGFCNLFSGVQVFTYPCILVGGVPFLPVESSLGSMSSSC